MQDNLIIMGINAPKAHQAVITHLIHGLADLYLKDKTHLFPYPETMIDEGQTSPAPDILLFDHKSEKTVVIIEITHTAGVKKDTAKVINLIQDYEVKEGFIYDYKKNIWYRTEGTDVTQDLSSSFCKSLQVDLSKLLKLISVFH